MKSTALCRLCKHEYGCHCLYARLEQGSVIQSIIKPLEIVPCNGFDIKTGYSCGCLEFQPIDNLEYLEWKEKQKTQQTFNQSNIW